MSSFRDAPNQARRSVLAQWRGLDYVPLESALRDRSRSVDRIVPHVLKTLNLDRRRAEAEVIKAWNSMIDPRFSAHAQPAGLVKGTLFVNVDSSAWLNELVRYHHKKILNQLQTIFGSEYVVRISFRIGG